MAACSASDHKVVGSSPAGASLLPEVSVVYVQPKPNAPFSHDVASQSTQPQERGSTVLYKG